MKTSFRESTVGKLITSVPVILILLFGTLGYSGWIYREYQIAKEEAATLEDSKKYPFNEAVWYGLYKTEVNVNYYTLADDKSGFKQKWAALGRKYQALKDNPNVTQKWLDCLYLEGWSLEHEETRPPVMSLLNQAQAVANEIVILRWQQHLTQEEIEAVNDWCISKTK